MRATIKVRRFHSAPSPYLVGNQTLRLLERLGLNDLRVETEDSHRATLSYRWREHDAPALELQYALDTHGIELV